MNDRLKFVPKCENRHHQFIIDGRCSIRDGNGAGWAVTAQPPTLELSNPPSVHVWPNQPPPLAPLGPRIEKQLNQVACALPPSLCMPPHRRCPFACRCPSARCCASVPVCSRRTTVRRPCAVLRAAARGEGHVTGVRRGEKGRGLWRGRPEGRGLGRAASWRDARDGVSGAPMLCGGVGVRRRGGLDGVGLDLFFLIYVDSNGLFGPVFL